MSILIWGLLTAFMVGFVARLVWATWRTWRDVRADREAVVAEAEKILQGER